ncbi:MAG: diguanylate cyclase [Novosphingobium sp.]
MDRAHRQAPVAIGAFVFLAVLLLLSGLIAWQASEVRRESSYWHTHTLEVLLVNEKVEIAALNVIRGQRGYILTGDREFLQPYIEGTGQLAGSIVHLGELTRDNPQQHARVNRLKGEARAYLAIISDGVQAMENGDAKAAKGLVKLGNGRAALLQVTGTIHEIETHERELLAQRVDMANRSERRNHMFMIVVGLSGSVMLAFALTAVGALRRAFAREAAYRDELRLLAGTDELTGIANRRELISGLNREIAASKRSDRPLAFALIDIDRFKRVNDTYGHPAGDEVIRKVARAALAAVRGCDLVGRVGGEEFAIVLPGAGVAQAYAICERLRQRIQSDLIELPEGETISVSISSGVSRLMKGETADELVARADGALYEAKQGGRDQVRLAA